MAAPAVVSGQVQNYTYYIAGLQNSGDLPGHDVCIRTEDTGVLDMARIHVERQYSRIESWQSHIYFSEALDDQLGVQL